MLAKTKDMTEGKPLTIMLLFALPLMAGNVFQQLYVIVDTLIVSRALGVTALAAMGSGDWNLFLFPVAASSFAQGFCILLGQRFGARDLPGLNRAFGHCVMLCSLIALGLCAVALGSLGLVLEVLRVPEDIRPMTYQYQFFFLLGIPACMLYNLAASVLRSLGNSRTPFIAMVIAAIINIVLDLLFVYGFHWELIGAAVATGLAQLFAGLFCVYALRRIPEVRLTKASFEREAGLTKTLFKLAIPLVAQMLLIGLGGMLVAYVVNGLGVAFIAGYTATNKLYGVLEVAAGAYGLSVVTFMAQNYGAKAYGRVRKGLRDAVMLSLLTGAVIAVLMIVLGKVLTGAFLSGEGAATGQAHEIAYQYLFIMSLGLPTLYLLYATRSMLQGIGNTLVPMLSGVAEFVMRSAMAFLALFWLGGIGIMLGEVIAWIGADLVLVPAAIRASAKLKPMEEKSEI